MGEAADGDALATLAGRLDRMHAKGETAVFWLRDDDATTPSPALDRLLDLCERTGCPVLIAVIPDDATQALARRLQGARRATACVHGFRHHNHAPADRKKTELIEAGPARRTADVLDELQTGRQRLEALFGTRLAPILVPPWNRMSDTVAARVHETGFTAISGFGHRFFPSPLAQLNTHVDLIDWQNGAAGHSLAFICDTIADHLDRPSAGAIGILGHHLAHDETAWIALEALLSMLARHPAARFGAALDLLPGSGGR